MNDSDPIDPELLAALRADFARPDPAAQTRVADRLAHGVGLAALRAARAPRGGPRWPAALRGPALGFVGSFALGGVCGAALFAALQRPAAPTPVPFARPLAPAAAAGPAREEAPSAPAPAPSASAPTPTESKPAAPSSAQPTASLAEQQALLDVARSAFGRADYPRALEVLKAHLRRFPKSALAEEREALEIKALAASGRPAQAHERALRFAQRYPQSLLLPSIGESLDTIP